MVFIKSPDPLQAKAIEIIHRIRKHTGLSVSDIARQAGLSPSTLTRAYPHPSVDYTLSSRTLAKLEAKFPTRGGGKMTAASLSESAPPPLAEHPQDALSVFSLELYQAAGDRRTLISQQLNLQGDHTAELWSDLRTHSTTTVPFMIGTGEKERLIGVHVAGDAMDPRLKAGEIAVIDKIKPVPLLADVLVRFKLAGKDVAIIIARIIKRDAVSMYFALSSDQNQVLTIPRSEIIDVFPIIAIITNSY